MMKRKTVDLYCFIIISKFYDLFHVLFCSEYNQRVILRQNDLLKHVKQDNTLLLYLRLVYNYSLLNIMLFLIGRKVNC